MDFQFSNSSNAVWFISIIVLTIVLILGYIRRDTLLHTIAASHLLSRLTITSSNVRRRFRIAIIVGVVILLCLCILDPRWGSRYREVEQTGIDAFFVLDVSRSMLAKDVRPNRLDRAKSAIIDVLDVMGSDRAGLITVAGDAVITVPLTLDYGSLQLSLDDVSTRSVNRGGTMIGDGIRLAQRSFTDDVPDHKVIIVLTDGEDMGSFPIEAAAEAANVGIDVYTVGIGDPVTGSRIPITRFGQLEFVTYEGEEVWSIMNADELTQIARSGGGAFVPAGTANLDLASIYQNSIATTAGRHFDSVKLEQFIPRFQWFAIPALLLLIGDSWMSLRNRSDMLAKTYEVTS